MNPNTARILRALFFVYVAVTFINVAYVVYHEPFAFDAWNVAHDTDAKPATFSRFFEYWHREYTSSNPRIGQPMAYLAYKLVGVAELVTPIAFLSIVLTAFIFGTGRWPRWRDNRDLATLAIGIGLLWIAAPNFPAYLFCRAYATNYVWQAAVQLWFLVPIRTFTRGEANRWSVPKLAAYFVLGVVAGMGNEHVGPTLILFVLLYGGWLWRKHRERPAFLWIGTLGLLVGYALVFFAPGQSQRYEGLAERYTLVQQILVRGIKGNMDIFLDMLEGAAPLLLILFSILAVGMLFEKTAVDTDRHERQRSAIIIVGVALLAAILMTITVFASPKLGPRFFMHGMFLLLGGVLAVVSSFLHRPKALLPFVVFAALISIFAFLRTVPMYTRLKRDSDERLAGLAAAPLGGNYTTAGWEQLPEQWWFLGDDFRDQKKQELVARYFGLHRVLFRGGDQWKMLGVTDVKLTMHYEFETPMCMDEQDQLDLKPYVGKDIGALHHAFLDSIAEAELVTGNKLRWIDLRATFLGTQPPMPAPTVFVAKWNRGELEGYTARLKRKGRSREREIALDDKLKRSPFDIYLVIIGDPPKRLGGSMDGKRLTYVPSKTGQYWALACRKDECFVILAVTHTL